MQRIAIARFPASGISGIGRVICSAATWEMPARGHARPVAVVLMAHGHGGTRDEAGAFARLAEALAARGIASLRIDFAGCGESSEPFEVNNLTTMRADLDAASVHARSRAGVDPDQVGLLGYSMGGRLAMLASTAAKYRALALWAPVGGNGAATMVAFLGGQTLWDSAKRSAQREGSASITTPWGQRQRLGEAWFLDLERSAPLTSIAAWTGPVLVLYGARDLVVPPSIPAAVAAHAAHSVSVQRRVLPHAGHGLGFYNEDARTAEMVIAATTEFFERKLQAR